MQKIICTFFLRRYSLIFEKALQMERKSGGVFQNWLRISQHALDKLAIFLDFQNLTEEVVDIEDRLLNLCAVWKFFQKHFRVQNGMLRLQCVQ